VINMSPPSIACPACHQPVLAGNCEHVPEQPDCVVHACGALLRVPPGVLGPVGETGCCGGPLGAPGIPEVVLDDDEADLPSPVLRPGPATVEEQEADVEYRKTAERLVRELEREQIPTIKDSEVAQMVAQADQLLATTSGLQQLVGRMTTLLDRFEHAISHLEQQHATRREFRPANPPVSPVPSAVAETWARATLRPRQGG
jgi:hypothetical protein